MRSGLLLRKQPASLFLFEGFGKGGDHLEEVADDAVVGDLEDGGVGVLVDGDDGLASLSSRPGAGWRRRCRRRGTAWARRSGRSCRPGAPSAASRRRRWGATRPVRRPALGQFLDERDILRFLDAAADRDERSAPRQDPPRARIRGTARAAAADLLGAQIDRHGRDSSGRRPRAIWSAR